MGKSKRKSADSSSQESSLHFFNSFNSGTDRSLQAVSSSTGNSNSSSLASLSRNFGNKKFKLSSTHNSSNNGSQLSEALSFSEIRILPAMSQSLKTDNELLGVFSRNTYVRKNSQSCIQNERNAEKALQHTTPDQNYLSSMFFDDPNYRENSIKEHFSQLTEDLLANVSVEEDANNSLKNSSTSDNSENTADMFDPETNLTRHFNKTFSDLQLSESSAENENLNITNHDSFLDEFMNENQIPVNAENPKNEKVQPKLTYSTSSCLYNQQDGDTELVGSETNFEDYLKHITFDSPGRIQLDDLNLDQTTLSNNAAHNSYNFPPPNLAGTLNNSLSSGALSTGSRHNFSDAAKRLRAGLNNISKDNTLIYTGPNPVLDEILGNRKKDLIRTKIGQILQRFIESIAVNGPLVFKVRNNTKWSNCIFQNDILKLKPLQDSSLIAVKYKNRRSRNKFNLIMYLIMKNYVLLQSGSYSTQREIYYQIKNYLGTQDTKIKEAMKTISSILNIEPWFFPIVSTSKGLVYGDLSLILSEEEIIRCNGFGGNSIPLDVTKIREFKSNACFILVVEKDAIFKKLLDEGLPNKLTRPFIVVTGKGFPDINTRLFVRKLWMSLRIPVFILVDADPDGIGIMLTYRFGSLSMAHLGEQLALPHIRWLGVFPSEIKKLKIIHQELNDFEKKKIKNILKRPYVEETVWLKRELQVLQENGVKAEIEGVMKSTAFLTDVYLPYKFYNRDYM